MSKCPSCGAELRFDPEKQLLVCDSCKNEYDPKIFDEAVLLGEKIDVHSYTCPQCGAGLYTLDDTAVTFCSYCGSSVALEEALTSIDRPKYVIPFKVSKEDCEKHYRSLLRRSLFVPSSMAKEEQIERFRGIYMPHWIYTVSKKGETHINTSRDRRSGDYVTTTTYSIDSDLDFKNHGISFDASVDYADELSQAVAPYDLSDAVKFDPDYLAGFYADTCSVDSAVYENEAKDIAEADVAAQFKKSSKEYSRYSVSYDQIEKAVAPKVSMVESALYPVWFLATRNKKGDRISYAVINGQTGKAVAELPISFGKYLLASLILAIPLFIIFNSILVLKPDALLMISTILSLIALAIVNKQINEIYASEEELDDDGKLSISKKNKEDYYREELLDPMTIVQKIGLWVLGFVVWFALFFLMCLGLFFISDIVMNLDDELFSYLMMLMLAVSIFGAVKVCSFVKNAFYEKEKVTYAPPLKKKVPVFLKPCLALIVSIVVFMGAPAYDVYYYGASLIMIILTVLTFYDIITQHNLMTTRKLPQFEKRGGDINV